MMVLRQSMNKVSTTVAEVKSNAEDFDEEEIEEVIAGIREQQTIQQEVCRAVGGVARSHGAAALGPLRSIVFKAIEEHLASPHSPPHNVFLAVSMTEDVIAECGPAVAAGMPKIMAILGKGFAKGSTPGLRRCAVYALGSACSSLGQRMGPHLGQLLRVLLPMAHAAIKRDRDEAADRPPFPSPPAPTTGFIALQE